MIFPIWCVHLPHSPKPISGFQSPISVTASLPLCCGSAGTLPPHCPGAHWDSSRRSFLTPVFFPHFSALSLSDPHLQLPGACPWVCPILDPIWQSSSRIVPRLVCLDSISPFGSEPLALSSSLVYTTYPLQHP